MIETIGFFFFFLVSFHFVGPKIVQTMKQNDGAQVLLLRLQPTVALEGGCYANMIIYRLQSHLAKLVIK